jgi:hypothetical protein
VQGDVFEEADLQAKDDDLTQLRGDAHVFAQCAELGEDFVPGAREFEAGRKQGGVEVENGTQLNLDAKLQVGC